jgi:hypothetical protein
MAVALLVVSAAEVALTCTGCCELIELGAVYRPEAESVPMLGLIDQVTAVFEVPLTVAVNCWVPPAGRLAVPGVTLIETTAAAG